VQSSLLDAWYKMSARNIPLYMLKMLRVSLYLFRFLWQLSRSWDCGPYKTPRTSQRWFYPCLRWTIK
jgi:hypothetical protein